MLSFINSKLNSMMAMPRIFLVTLFGGVIVGAVGLALYPGTWNSTILKLLLILLGLVIIGAIVLLLVKVYSAKKSKKLGDLLVGEVKSEGPSSAAFKQAGKDLSDQWENAITTLKERDVNLYEMPWYCIIGEPASGKTTLLTKSGIQFLLGTNPLPGGSGTRNCEFLFAKAATIIDTAGRFTFPQPGTTDESEWENFLRIMTSNRAKCPINGVIVTIPCTSLLEDDAETQKKKAQIINKRVKQMQSVLGIVFPVYVLVTKCDRILGFTEFFSKLPALKQNQIVGWTNPSMSAEEVENEEILQNLQTLAQRFRGVLFSHLADEMDSPDRDPVFLFPREFSSLAPKIADYCEQIFKQEFHEENLLFRGVYFSSGVQQGKPIALACAQILSDVSATNIDLTKDLETVFTKSRAFFISDLFKQKIFPEFGLVSPSRKRLKKVKKLQAVISIMFYTLLSAMAGSAVLGGIFINKEMGYAKESLNECKHAQAGEYVSCLNHVPKEIDDYSQKKHAGWSWLNPVYFLGSKRDTLYEQWKDEFLEKTETNVIKSQAPFKNLSSDLKDTLSELRDKPQEWTLTPDEFDSSFTSYLRIREIGKYPDAKKDRAQLQEDLLNLYQLVGKDKENAALSDLLSVYLYYQKDQKKVSVFDDALTFDFAKTWRDYWRGQVKGPTGKNWDEKIKRDFERLVLYNDSVKRINKSFLAILELLKRPRGDSKWVDKWNVQFGLFDGANKNINSLIEKDEITLTAHIQDGGMELDSIHKVKKAAEKSYNSITGSKEWNLEDDVKETLDLESVLSQKFTAEDAYKDIFVVEQPSAENPFWKITPSKQYLSLVKLIQELNKFFNPTGDKITFIDKYEKGKLTLKPFLDSINDINESLKNLIDVIETDFTELNDLFSIFLDGLPKDGDKTGEWLGVDCSQYLKKDNIASTAKNYRIKRFFNHFLYPVSEPETFFSDLDQVFYKQKKDWSEKLISESSFLKDHNLEYMTFSLGDSTSFMKENKIKLMMECMGQLESLLKQSKGDENISDFIGSFHNSYRKQFERLCDYFFNFDAQEKDDLKTFCDKNMKSDYERQLRDALPMLKKLAEAYLSPLEEDLESDTSLDALNFVKNCEIARVVSSDDGVERLKVVFEELKRMGEDSFKKSLGEKTKETDLADTHPVFIINQLIDVWNKKENGSGRYLGNLFFDLKQHLKREYGDFTASDAKKLWIATKDRYFGKSPFSPFAKQELDEESFEQILKDLKFIARFFDENSELGSEILQWIGFLSAFSDKGYEVTVKIDSDNATAWHTFKQEVWYGVKGLDLTEEGQDCLKVSPYDESKLRWNPIKRDKALPIDGWFIVYLKSRNTKDIWYLSEAIVKESESTLQIEKQSSFTGAWGLLEYLLKFKKWGDIETEDQLVFNHEIKYKFKSGGKEKSIDLKMILTFDPPFKTPPKTWWENEKDKAGH